MKTKKRIPISIVVPAPWVAAIDKVAAAQGRDRTKQVRQWIKAGIENDTGRQL